jgi:hypothetical protein
MGLIDGANGSPIRMVKAIFWAIELTYSYLYIYK